MPRAASHRARWQQGCCTGWRTSGKDRDLPRGLANPPWEAPPPAENVVVVAHGGPLRAIAGHLLGMPPERWLGLDFGCGLVTRIDVESWGVVLKWFNR